MVKKHKILGGGGLGDAVMLYSKLMQLDIPIDEIELTHIEVPANLLKVIAEFYASQGINAVVKQIPSWDWKKENSGAYDIVLDTSAYGIEEDGIEINPFPEFIRNREYVFDVVISPSSGRNGERSFSVDEIKMICDRFKGINQSEQYHKNIILLGTSSNADKYNNLEAINGINLTDIDESIDIIASSKYVIAPSGFVSIVGCMARKNVFTKDDRKDIQSRYYHEKWNNKFINNLNEIII